MIRRPRLRTVAVAAGLALVVAVAAVSATGLLTAGSAPVADDGAPPVTATVTRADISETVDVDGTVSYGDPIELESRSAGTLTAVAAQSTVVSRGQALFAVDARPVFLLYGSVPLYRPLAEGATGADVAVLESNLAALGYASFTVDDDFTRNTATAVRRWQDDAGVPVTGTVAPAGFQVAPGPVRIARQDRRPGEPAGPGRPVLAYTSASRIVRVDLETADQRYVRAGTAVTVEQQDHAMLPATVTTVGTVATTTSESDSADRQQPATTIPVTVAPRGRHALTAPEGAPVTVHLVSSQRKDVLTVPVAALLALAEGGYGLQVVGDTGTRAVAVRTGLFGGGRVEVSGTGLREGLRVGMPAP